ncbi:type I secretion system permease/ATPase [Rodentibacter pneumotropicus]|uniref:Type I secretion system permease/ATPase n=2 Tax=Rodentibacter pneumotropicus TaxID=758 RepID=A0A4S2Q721_9PAST|nr:type I secretion system permease/ATPase [Rodentibacter pneumotropicus]TGZ99159.1 type I secretion system permease/ATPase [Rodentibacter pneumotropicus]THA00646.1 type I secretion system permease/ATPase [Rodentibacter pneumotropicus]THA04910.1 type I secretion system permease/ATPase [Rodentibacter pneumotropicus]THA12512.1 type I secretion system permease/ATPase [Rodentibacter pneumotropicus]
MKSIIEHLALVTQLHGTPIAQEALTAQVIRDQRLDVNFSSLREVLKTYGFENSISKRELTDIPSLATPVVAILEDEEALVITKIEGSGINRRFHIRQTDKVERVLDYKELKDIYLGYCWFIKPKVTSDIRSELPEYHLPKAWFWKVIWRFKAYYGQVILATFIINFLALVSSLYVMNVYDRVIPNKTYETLWALSIGVVLAISFEFAAKMIRGHLTDIAGKKADLIISSALFRRVMALRLIDKPASSGSYANNLRDFESVREFMTSASLLVLVDLPFLFLFVFVIYLIGGKLALVPLIIIPTVILVGIAVQPKLAARINESMRESSQRQGLIVEALDGIETLKANNATNWVQQRWDMYTAKTSASQIKVKDLSNFVVNFSVGLQQLNTVFLVLLGTYLIHSEDEASRITMGALIASVILSGRALAPLAQIAGLATRFQQARLALKGVDDIVNRPIERVDDRKYITLKQTQGKISFNNVNFQYNKESPNALSQLSITINPGEKVAILGRVGSGKSTLLKLAAGLYEPHSGNVTLDNVDLRQIDPNYLRNQVALFGQSPRLFLGTLRENLDIARADNFAGDVELVNALYRFGLEHLVNSHPRGLDMPLGENGQGLSGGQKQLVALARLTIKDPRVVLLDEPTSDLDQGTEEMVLQALARWMGNRTMIMVTHRPQVLKLVNRIIVIDNGKVAIDGPRDAVLEHLRKNEQQQVQKSQPQQKQAANTAEGEE